MCRRRRGAGRDQVPRPGRRLPAPVGQVPDSISPGGPARLAGPAARSPRRARRRWPRASRPRRPQAAGPADVLALQHDAALARREAAVVRHEGGERPGGAAGGRVLRDPREREQAARLDPRVVATGEGARVHLGVVALERRQEVEVKLNVRERTLRDERDDRVGEARADRHGLERRVDLVLVDAQYGGDLAAGHRVAEGRARPGARSPPRARRLRRRPRPA